MIILFVNTKFRDVRPRPLTETHRYMNQEVTGARFCRLVTVYLSVLLGQVRVFLKTQHRFEEVREVLIALWRIGSAQSEYQHSTQVPTARRPKWKVRRPRQNNRRPDKGREIAEQVRVEQAPSIQNSIVDELEAEMKNEFEKNRDLSKEEYNLEFRVYGRDSFLIKDSIS